MNPQIIIHGLHKDLQGQMVNYEIIIPRTDGETRLRGSALVGTKIEIPIFDEHQPGGSADSE